MVSVHHRVSRCVFHINNTEMYFFGKCRLQLPNNLLKKIDKRLKVNINLYFCAMFSRTQ